MSKPYKKRLALAPPPCWFQQLVFGATKLLTPSEKLPHYKHDLSDLSLQELQVARDSLSNVDHRAIDKTATDFKVWGDADFLQPAIVWHRAALSVVDTVVTPVYLRTVGSLGTLDRNFNSSESLVLFASAACGGFMSIGHTRDGIETSNGAHGIVMMCRVLGEMSAKSFSVALAKELPLKNVLKLAALALCADGCRHIYSTFMELGSFECDQRRDDEYLASMCRREVMSSAIWNLHLALLCMDLVANDFPDRQFSLDVEKQLNESMDDILGEDIAIATSYLLAQIDALNDGVETDKFSRMERFVDRQRLLTWRTFNSLLEELQRLSWIANSSMKKRHKIGALEIPKLKTSLMQRLTMRNSGQILADAWYPLKI